MEITKFKIGDRVSSPVKRGTGKKAEIIAGVNCNGSFLEFTGTIVSSHNNYFTVKRDRGGFVSFVNPLALKKETKK